MRALTGLHCLTRCLAVASLAIFNLSQIRAENVASIEEDWQLDAGMPSSARSALKITCLTSTGAGTQSQHVIFLINETGSVGGNVQLQLWNGDQLLATTDVPGTREVLSKPGECVNWTTRLSVSNGVLTAEVLNFSSSTWGSSTGKATIATVATLTTLSDLNSYDPNVTCQSSGVEFGSMRVHKLTLRKTRIYTGKQKSVETSLDRVIFQNN